MVHTDSHAVKEMAKCSEQCLIFSQGLAKCIINRGSAECCATVNKQNKKTVQSYSSDSVQTVIRLFYCSGAANIAATDTSQSTGTPTSSSVPSTTVSYYNHQWEFINEQSMRKREIRRPVLSAHCCYTGNGIA